MSDHKYPDDRIGGHCMFAIFLCSALALAASKMNQSDEYFATILFLGSCLSIYVVWCLGRLSGLLEWETCEEIDHAVVDNAADEQER